RLAGRRRPPCQQLPDRRRADYRAAREGCAQPDDRGGRGSEGPGPHVRLRDGTPRRRRVQPEGQAGHEQRSRGGPLSAPTRLGAGFYQTRPVWGQSLNYFDAQTPGKTKENTGLADAYYRLYGGGAGGPVVKDRTFFWVATEGYRSGTTRGLSEIWPSINQRNGDLVVV